MDLWIALLLMLAAGNYFINALKRELRPSVCYNEACNISAQIILSNMDPNVNPCEDFYDFACGGFVRNAEISPDEVESSAFTEIEFITKPLLKSILLEKPNPRDPKFTIFVKELYNMCLDEDEIKKVGLSRATEVLQQAGGWPVINQEWNDKNWNYLWQEIQLNLLLHGAGILVVISVEQDSKNTSRRLIHVDQPYPGLAREYLIKGFDNPYVQAYYKYMVNVAVLFGAREEVARKEFIECVHLEIDLAKITSSMEERRDFSRLYNKFTMEELSSGPMAWIDWMHLFVGIMPADLIGSLDEVIIMETNYIVALKNVLNTYSKRTIANWMMWRAVQSLEHVLTKEVKDYQLQFENIVTGKKSGKANWEHCLLLIEEKFPVALSSMYIKNHFDEKTKQLATNMAEQVRLAMLDLIAQANWMDDLTKGRAIEKLNDLVKIIGYTPEVINDAKVELLYRGLKINRKSFLDAWIAVRKFLNDQVWFTLEEEVLKFDWKEHSNVFTSNAYYDKIANCMNFPAAVLQLPFYHTQRPLYLNYGAIGSVMGHEITHGYDDEGSQFNGKGEVIDWWEEGSKQKFQKQVECVINQFGLFKETFNDSVVHVNGVNTQGENVADMAAMRLAYRAYKNLKIKEDIALPGLEHFTQDQLMLLSTANFWCTKTRPDELRNKLTAGTHIPEHFRVNGMMMNFQEFGKIFHCKPGTPMNPLNKCQVW